MMGCNPAQVTGWPSPMAGTPAQNGNNEAGNNDSSRRTVALAAGWPTPKTPTGGAESAERKKELGRTESGGGDLQAVSQLAGWTTPQAMEPDAEMRPSRAATGRTTDYLGRQAHLTAGWLTPSANEDAAGTANGDMQNMLSHQAMLTGSEANGSTAATGNKDVYRLNVHFSRWLQGYPVEWQHCADTATASSRKSPRSSSKPTSKQNQKLPNWLS